MPELPDVEAFKRYLDATSLHQAVEGVIVRTPRLLEGTSKRRFSTHLKGRRFERTRRRGKYLGLETDDSEWLILHFGMTGRPAYYRRDSEDPPFARVLVDFDNGYRLAYCSQRKIGKLRLVNDFDAFAEEQRLGIDALDPQLNLRAFRELAADRRGMLKSFLMNQGVMAGLGNIYADEVLFQARLHPRRRLEDLDDKKVKRLFRVMKRVLQTSADKRAEPGKLPRTYLLPHRRGDRLCPVCGGRLKTTKINNRTSWFCPRCQPAPGGR